MAKKESPKAQELGPKRYKKLVEDSHKFYDKYKAGKRDPKTGVYYNEINFKKPGSKNTGGSLITDFQCFTENCGNIMSIRRNTAGICCSNCKKFHSISVDKITEKVTVNGVCLDEFGQPEQTISGTE